MSVHNALRFDSSVKNYSQPSPDTELPLSELQKKGTVTAIAFSDDDEASDEVLMKSLSAGLPVTGLSNGPDIRKPAMSLEDASAAIAKDFSQTEIKRALRLVAEAPSANRTASEISGSDIKSEITTEDAARKQEGVDFSSLSGHSMRLAKLIDMLIELLMKIRITDDQRKSKDMDLQTQAVDTSAEKTKAAGKNVFWGSVAGGVVGLSLSGATAVKGGMKTTSHAKHTGDNINQKNLLEQKNLDIDLARNNPGLKPGSSPGPEADMDLINKAGSRNAAIQELNNRINGDQLTYQRSMAYTNIGHTASQAAMGLSTNTAEMKAADNRSQANIQDNVSRIHSKGADNNTDTLAKEDKLAQTLRDLVLQLLAAMQQTQDKIINSRLG